MKILVNFLIFLFSYLNALEEESCGYFGTRGDKIEKQLDDCYKKNVISNRVRMSVGFEICFGYNYKKLNDTIAEPLDHHRNIAIDEVNILQNETCRIENQKQRPTTENGDINYSQESKNLKEYAFNDDQDTLQTYLDANDELVEQFFPDNKSISLLKNDIVKKLQDLNSCKQPENAMREKLIKKFLQEFLNDLADPSQASFSPETYDVLKNPDKYAKFENKKVQIENFSTYDINQDHLLRHNEIKKRNIQLKARDNDLEKLINKSAGMRDEDFREQFSKWGDSQEVQGFKVNMEVPDRVVPWREQPFQQSSNPALKLQTQQDAIAINDFWNKDIKIKDKRINDEDFDRYKIKGWDIDRKIKKLFKSKSRI